MAANRHGVQLPADIFQNLNQFKIRLAGSVGNIPTTGDIINALLIIGDKHYDEIIDIIRDTPK